LNGGYSSWRCCRLRYIDYLDDYAGLAGHDRDWYWLSKGETQRRKAFDKDVIAGFDPNEEDGPICPIDRIAKGIDEICRIDDASAVVHVEFEACTHQGITPTIHLANGD
jgi:hypothetical protein